MKAEKHTITVECTVSELELIYKLVRDRLARKVRAEVPSTVRYDALASKYLQSTRILAELDGVLFDKYSTGESVVRELIE